MLETLRKSTKSWIIKILFVLLILSFGIWGVEDVVRLNASRSPAITVGHTDIAVDQVVQEFKRQVRQLQSALGGNLTEEQARQLGLLDNTIDQMVVRGLLDQAADDFGMLADDDALRRNIAAMPAFRNQLNQFDPNMFRQALASAGLSEERFVAMERQNMLRSQLVDAVSGGTTAPQALIEPLFRHRQEKRVAEVVTFLAENLTAPPLPDEAGLRDYHQKNSGKFMAPEYRGVTVLTIRPGDVSGDIKITDEMVTESYEQRIDEFQETERRNIQQILFDDEAQANRAGELLKQGVPFEEIAKTVAAAPKEIINLGWMERKSLLPELADAVFALQAGQVSRPIQSPLGWHMFKVADVSAGRTRPLADVRDQLAQDLTKEKAVDRLYELANKIDDLLAGGASLEETARQLGLQTAKLEAIDPQGMTPKGEPAANAPQSQEFLTTAFATAQSAESQLTEMEGNGYFVVRVDSITPPALKPFEAIHDEVADAWRIERRQALAEEQAKAAADRLGRGEAPATVAADLRAAATGTTPPFIRAGAKIEDLPPALIEKLFRLKPGEAAMADTTTGAVAARLKSVIAADPKTDAAALQRVRDQSRQAIANDIVQQYVAALRGQYRVSVNRKLVEDQFE